MRKALLLSLILLTIHLKSFSQNQASYNFYTEESGIFNEEIYNITSDENGILYFNSSTGAEYFDGTKFYKFKDVQKNIFNKFPKLSYSKNKLVFNTLKEVYFFDGKYYTLFFKELGKNPISNLNFSKNGLFAIYSINTKVYIRSVIMPNLYIEIYDSKAPTIKYKYFNFTENGDVLISATNGLFVSKNRITHSLSNNISYKTFIDDEHRFIYSVSQNCIEIFNFENNLIKSSSYRNDYFKKLDINLDELKVYSYLINNHIYIYSPVTNHKNITSNEKEIFNFVEDSKNIYDVNFLTKLDHKINYISIPSTVINATYFYANNRNEVWISTTMGLLKINLNKVIPEYKFIKTRKSINNIIADKNKYVISDNNLGLQDIDSNGSLKENVFSKLLRNKLNFDFTESSYCLLFGTQRNLLVGTIDKGIIEIDSNHNIHFLTKNLEGFERVCMALNFDKKGNIISGGYNKLVKIDSLRNITFIEHPQLSKKFIYSIRKIDEQLFIFSDNNILILEDDSLIDFSTQLNIYNTNFSNIAKLNNKYVITTFNNGIYVIGKNSINKWHVEHHFNKSNGLSSNDFYDIEIDNGHKIWLLSPHTIDILRYSNNTYKIVSLKNDIHLKNEFHSESSIFIDSNDFIYFGGKNGVTLFDTKKIKLDTVNTGIVNISAIYINDEIYTHTNINKDYNLNETVQKPILAFNENNIKLEFSAVDFSENKIFYQYRLQGLEDDWKLISKENSINYRNLPSGQYSFLIRYSVNGNWSKITHYPFTILAPWWKTLFAFILYIILSAALGYYIISRYIKKVDKKYQQKLNRIKEKNQLLHLQSSALLNQLKPHFVFNALAPLQHYIYTSDREKGISYLQSFSNLLRSMLNHSREPFVFLLNEIEFIHNYLIQQQIQSNNSFQFEIINKVETNLKIPSLIIQPIIENAIQHGMSEDENNRIEITFASMNENYLSIKIADNGKGFNLNKQLSITKNRALHIISDKIELYKQNDNFRDVDLKTSYEQNQFIITLILPYTNEN